MQCGEREVWRSNNELLRDKTVGCQKVEKFGDAKKGGLDMQEGGKESIWVTGMEAGVRAKSNW